MNIPIVTPVINWRNQKNNKGLYSIHLRIYLHPEPYRYYPVKIPAKVRLDQWTEIDGVWVSNSHPFAFEINTRIAEIKGKITDLAKRFYNQGKPITFYAIEREILRKGDRSLLNDYFRNYIDRPPENVQLDTMTWVARIKKYLSEQRGRKGKLEPATIKSYFDKFKVVLTHAAKKDHLLDAQAVEQYFDDITISIPKKKEGQHLEIEEIQGLRKLEFEKKGQSLERDRDLFLFQVYTGFYYNDLQILKKTQLFKDIEYGYYIIGERDKNGNPTIIPLYKFPYAAHILEKYADKNPSNEFLFRKEIFIEVQAYNRNLKLLQKRAGIIRPLSNKTGRHTNAQMWIRFGADRPVLSKMMEHQKEATTENYYKVNLREVIDGTRSVNFEQYAI